MVVEARGDTGRYGGGEMNGAGRESKLPSNRHLILLEILCFIFLMPYWGYLLLHKGIVPFWGDETFTLRVGQGSWGNFKSDILSDVHPPLYFALNWFINHLSRLLTGDFFTGRTLELILSMALYLVIPVELMRIRKFPAAGFTGIACASIFIITSAHLLLFLPMMRYYGLAALLVFITSIQLFPDEKIPKSAKIWTLPKHYVLFGIALWLALATSYLTVIVVPAYFLFITRMEKSYRDKYLKSLAITLVCAIPLLILAIYQSQAITGSEFPGLLPFVKGFIARFGFTVYSFLLGEFIRPWDFYLSLPALAALVFLLFLAYRVKTDRFEHLINLLLWISLPLGVLVLTFLGIGLEFSASRLTFLAPFFLLLLVQAPFLDGVTLTQRNVGITAIVLLIILNMVSTVNYLLGRNYIQSTYIIPWQEISNDLGDYGMHWPIVLCDDDTFKYWLPWGPMEETPVINLHALTPESAEAIFTESDWVCVVFSPSVFSQEEVESLIYRYSGGKPELVEEKDYLVEDETSMRWKSMLLGREISKVKKKLVVYNIQR